MTAAKQAFIKIRCTPEERDQWNGAAALDDKTISNVVREALDAQLTNVKNAKRRRAIIHKADPDLILAINRIGSNLNQIARRVNIGNIESGPLIEQLNTTYQQLLRLEHACRELYNAH